MIAGIGVDVVDIARLAVALDRTPELGRRLFTEGELELARLRGNEAVMLAGCFASKEALAKVLGAPRGLRWHDAEVVRNGAGRPFLEIRGTVAAVATGLGIRDWHLSISHDGGVCVAMVVGET